MPGPETLLPTLLATLAYLLGSVPTAVLVCRSMGLADPREQGSRNPGTTNVLRQGNRTAAVLTLLGDVSKGAIAVNLARYAELGSTQTGLCALAVLLGHIYPLFGRMRGGKGVATTFGLCLALSPPLGLIALGVWLLLAAIGKTASLASVGTALVTPLATFMLLPEQFAAISLICLLLVLRHRDNIRRLLRGLEHRL
ncbi:glycerol-3-phosphate 1-O-acyltransferase PlsY [Marinobacterium sedimentorum]|uniref:glycerol-3-phosphate 1-O-acyltransferase PlsY n=1 Tax=Marinobacterium sedimentorum TaxID=2927804 RepID=UPI0020C73757|nr:glycerol-3-phosphate 1-O-acyltransferase PlsY [Marinobacterium sedimentorum]MCP8689141.1 glycerol-3-phosphate 1-O-acyltransferase PlsY [Marinobacterium sedimentorum]